MSERLEVLSQHICSQSVILKKTFNQVFYQNKEILQKIKKKLENLKDYQTYNLEQDLQKKYLKQAQLIQILDSLLAVLFIQDISLACIIQNHLEYINLLEFLGSHKHQEYIEKAKKFEDIGCIAFTELSHFSNLQDIETICNYDPQDKLFILTSFDNGIKIPIPNLMIANRCIVFSNFYQNKKIQGIQGFIMYLRKNDNSLKENLIIGDAQIQSIVVPSGYLQCKNYRIPELYRLDKFSSFDGNKLLSKYTKEEQLSIIQISRDQFRFTLNKQINNFILGLLLDIINLLKQKIPPSLELQINKILVDCYINILIMKYTFDAIQIDWLQNKKDLMSLKIHEIHSLLFAIQYIQYSSNMNYIQILYELLSSYDLTNIIQKKKQIFFTYYRLAGDPTLQLQQTSKFLFESYRYIQQQKKIPFESLQFLSKSKEKIFLKNSRKQFIDQIENNVIFLLQKSTVHFQDKINLYNNVFKAWSYSQQSNFMQASELFGYVIAIKKFQKFSEELNVEKPQLDLQEFTDIWMYNAILQVTNKSENIFHEDQIQYIDENISKLYVKYIYQIQSLIQELSLNY